MESIAKTVTICDNCKSPMKKEEDLNGDFIQAILGSKSGENQNMTYCSEECLRQHLNVRAKRKRAMASVIEIEFPIHK